MMTNKQAYDYWKRKYESARDYRDEHWDAEERHTHQEYVEALLLAICALGVWCTPVEKIKFIGDTVMMPIADFNKLNAENKNNGLLKEDKDGKE